MSSIKDKASILLGTLDLEEIDVDIFRGNTLWCPPISQRIYGGQVIGQALVAASKTVDEQFSPHSLHSYFLRAGDPSIPILYKVERIRNGHSYCCRNVYAIQQGLTIYSSQISFCKFEETVIEHQANMPNAPDPETLPTNEERLRRKLELETNDNNRLLIKKTLASPIPIDYRRCKQQRIDIIEYPSHQNDPPYQLLWFRGIDKIGPELKNLHSPIIGYASDCKILYTATLPHANFQFTMASTLDHSMWFHLPVRADEWLLHEIQSPKLNNGRVLILGKVFTRDGQLAVSIAQEGLLRGSRL
ncbi:Acyl-coenzyme A thioesterase 8 [Trichoplax sp. H2]|nr:Acyl-coenzyme A thioesterase 8 [Trichoplax sp. H2]|eukprot:RDD46901.1 Acyl-coenzyme A thioesterase 8 [Trichoplax sp. H2]